MEHFGERLKSARKMKGWSLQDLSDQMNNAVSKQALNKYENGEMKPSGEVLLVLSKALDVQPDFFLKKAGIILPEVEFRKKPSLSAKQIESIKETVKHFLERYLEVENLLNIKAAFYNPVSHIQISSEKDIEYAAMQLLDKWNLGWNPIPNVIEMLEEKGVRVIEIEAPSDFDGLSTYVGNIPVVVLNKAYTAVRKRFTALHELGHLVLNIHPGGNKEKICNAFAGAMLLPDHSLEGLIGNKRNNIMPGELVSIKEQFGISFQAIIMRALQKGIINNGLASRFFSTFTQLPESPLPNYGNSEKSYRFNHLLYRLAAEDIVSISKAANLANMKLADFRKKLEATEEM